MRFRLLLSVAIVMVLAACGRSDDHARDSLPEVTANRGSIDGPPNQPSAQHPAEPPAGAPSLTQAPQSSVPPPSRRRGKPPLPPLPVAQMAPRSIDLIRDAYEFAADHPEILQYVPCYCGCERRGHDSNVECFVSSRTSNGRVTWDPHGMG